MKYADITFRPIDRWPGTLTGQRRRAPFRTPWGTTIKLLERELTFLQARRVVFQIAIREGDLRIDGKPRAQAKAEHPGVIIAFDSKYGPLKYAVDAFKSWDDNVRAIALAMEALRKVDRYGVTKRGEQYTGWRELPQSTSTFFHDPEEAERFLAHHGGYREAARRFHPDNSETGDSEMMTKLNAAKEMAS